MKLLNDFERIVILKTLIFDIDLNFLCENDLNKIASAANAMEIDLNHLLYENLDYPDYYDLEEVYNEWKEDILFMYDDIKNDLLKKIKRLNEN